MTSPGNKRWRPAYVGIGSNLQGPSGQVESAIESLSALDDTRLVLRSALYRSAPFGGIEQPHYVNAVAALLTTLDARQLLDELQQIELRRGRRRDGMRWGPRIIDLDILVFASQSIDEPGLVVPHPGIAERNFVLLPLREIAPGLVIPGLGPVSKLPVNMEEPQIERIA